MDVSVAADTTIEAYSGGLAGGATVALGGSFSLNESEQVAQAWIRGVTLQASGSVAVTAANDSAIDSFGGGLAGVAKASVGAAISKNRIDDTTEAWIDGSADVDATGTLTLDAGAEQSIASLAFGGAGAEFFALGGSLSDNAISSTTRAFITGSSDAAAGGDAQVHATDDSTIRAFAGGVGIYRGRSPQPGDRCGRHPQRHCSDHRGLGDRYGDDPGCGERRHPGHQHARDRGRSSGPLGQRHGLGLGQRCEEHHRRHGPQPTCPTAPRSSRRMPCP